MNVNKFFVHKLVPITTFTLQYPTRITVVANIYCHLLLISFNLKKICHQYWNYYTNHQNKHFYYKFWIEWMVEFGCAIYFIPSAARDCCPDRIHKIKTMMAQYNETSYVIDHMAFSDHTVWMDGIIILKRDGLTNNKLTRLKRINCLLFWGYMNTKKTNKNEIYSQLTYRCTHVLQYLFKIFEGFSLKS